MASVILLERSLAWRELVAASAESHDSDSRSDTRTKSVSSASGEEPSGKYAIGNYCGQNSLSCLLCEQR